MVISREVKDHVQPRTQACSRYTSDQRRFGTERDRRIFPTSLTGDVTSEIAEDDWERGWITFTSNGKPGFVPRDQVSSCLYLSFGVYCSLFLHLNK